MKVKILKSIATGLQCFDVDSIVELDDTLAIGWDKAGVVQIMNCIEIPEEDIVPKETKVEEVPEIKEPKKSAPAKKSKK